MEGWCFRYLAKEKKSCMCILNTLTRLWLQDKKVLIVDPLILSKISIYFDTAFSLKRKIPHKSVKKVQ